MVALLDVIEKCGDGVIDGGAVEGQAEFLGRTLQAGQVHVAPQGGAIEDQDGLEQAIAQEQPTVARIDLQIAWRDGSVEPDAVHGSSFRKLRSMS